MPTLYRVALLGFSEFERNTLASYFRLATHRTPGYRQAPALTDADFVVADADHAPSVQLVMATERLEQTVFIGAQAPPSCSAWMARPIDPLHVLRELDAMVVLATARTGATTLDLPSPAAAPAAGSSVASPRPAPVAAPRALLVDDSEIALRHLELRLQPWGVQTERAATGQRALELLAQQAFDCVFADIELGDASELDGLALCHAVKRSPRGSTVPVPAVFMVSAHHTELDRVRGALAGCDAFLGKPLDEVELHRLLLRQGWKPPREAGPGVPGGGAAASGARREQR